MIDLTLIVPSKGRPQSVEPFMQAVNDSKETSQLRVVWAIDADDTKHSDYLRALEGYADVDVYTVPSWKPMVAKLNEVARDRMDTSFALAFMGDDHRPRTKGWDRLYVEALKAKSKLFGCGIVFGNDLIWQHQLPTQVAMTSNIVKKLGYMVPETINHMWCDNFWLDIGKATDVIRYLPHVTVEHLHPIAGKAQTDEVYAASDKYMESDRIAYETYLKTYFNDDIKKIKELRYVC